MAQSASASKPVPKRRKSNAGTLLAVIVVLGVLAATFLFAFLSPVRLAVPQMYVLALLHGGIADVQEQTSVECVAQTQDGTPAAITRFTRTVIFNDTTSLVVIFDGAPTPTQLQCSG